MINIDDWSVDHDTFIKKLDKYQVEIKEIQPKHINESIKVTIWLNSNENNKTTLYCDNFEEAFGFVDDFINQKSFDKMIRSIFYIRVNM